MPQQKRRVSYIIPSPTEAVPRLQLPPHSTSRLGSVGPLLIPLINDLVQDTEDAKPNSARHPRHRLGVSSLALDTSTQLAGRGSPEGILYSGGRDGLIMSWDLGLPMKKRRLKAGTEQMRRDGRWEIMTGWADDAIDEEAEDGEDRPQSDGDILGEVTANASRRRRTNSKTIPYEHQWETDLAAFKPGKVSLLFLSIFRPNAVVHVLSRVNFGNVHKPTQIGSTISCCAITIKLVRFGHFIAWVC